MFINFIFYVFVFIFGLIIGSFLNVLILRYNTGVSAFKGRSFCFSCGKKLSPLELIPLVSFIIQKGKCQGCQSKISWQYPIVEISTALLFVAVFWKYTSLSSSYFNIWHLIIGLLTMAVLVFITVYDGKHKIIPDSLIVVFCLLALFKIALDFNHAVGFLLAGPILALPFFLIWLFSKGRFMGLGDPKFMLGIGWFLGPIYGLSAIVLAFWAGAIYGLGLMFLSKFSCYGLKINRKTEIPFAPFLVLGFLLVYFFNIDVLGLGWFML